MIGRFGRWLVLLVLALVGWWLLRSRKRPGAGDSSTGPRAVAGGELVRDRQCNTFIERSRALTAQRDGQTHYFCSEACRERFLSAATRT
jgi:YHS domain-containing protein